MGIFNIFKKKTINSNQQCSKQTIDNAQKKSNKRKTIPAEIKELVKAGKDEEVKKIMSKCMINAYDTFTKNTILSYEGISDDLVKYFIEQGYDINYMGRWGTPLHAQAGNRGSNLPLFLELGADINAFDYQNEIPLHKAAMMRSLANIKTLVEAGSKINQASSSKMTPLHEVVARMHLSQDIESIPCIEYLLAHGAIITPGVKASVTRQGEEFEFHRHELVENVDIMEANLNTLYNLCDVKPVPKRVMYDGVSPIVLKSKRWQDQHQELWTMLVPGSGHAGTLQGEIIRVAGRLSNEIMDNGAVNWDDDYRKMVKAIPAYFAQGNTLSNKKMEELHQIIKVVIKGRGDEELDRLAQLGVEWVLLNPNPIALTSVNYKR